MPYRFGFHFILRNSEESRWNRFDWNGKSEKITLAKVNSMQCLEQSCMCLTGMWMLSLYFAPFVSDFGVEKQARKWKAEKKEKEKAGKRKRFANNWGKKSQLLTSKWRQSQKVQPPKLAVNWEPRARYTCSVKHDQSQEATKPKSPSIDPIDFLTDFQRRFSIWSRCRITPETGLWRVLAPNYPEHFKEWKLVKSSCGAERYRLTDNFGYYI